MKLSLALAILYLGYQQTDRSPEGLYADYFGRKIELRNNHTFFMHWDNHKNSSKYKNWTFGRWSMEEDTIYFTQELIFDSVQVDDETLGYHIKKVRLSADTIRDQLYYKSFNLYFKEIPRGNTQGKLELPEKLLFRNNRLFRIQDNNTLEDKQRTHTLTGIQYYTWFEKQ
jgi:hypothetical protein